MSNHVYILLTVVLWILFFVFQVFVLLEIPVTISAIILCIALFAKHETGEIPLFLFGLIMALVIELGLGLVARTQHWDHASLWGIPIWLPLIWGYGFVVMRRVGNAIVNFYADKS